MTTYYDALNSFFNSLGAERTASSAQLVYLHLLQLNNRSGNGGSVQVTDRELSRLTQLTRPTITRAKQILKNRGLIDFKSDAKNPRAGTCYELKIFTRRVSQSVSQSLSQSLSQTVSQSDGVPIIRVREDLKTLDKADMRTARARTDCVDTESALVKTWRDNNGAPVTAELLSYFAVLVDKYGVERTDELIKSAANHYGGQYSMTPAFLRKHVEISEGGMTRGKSNVVSIRQRYQSPDTRFDSEFGL